LSRQDGVMRDSTWLRKRNRGLHVTIRDVDCAGFDVERFIADLKRMHVTFFSFFVGGYVTTYPTELAYQRVSPYLGGRDLTAEIVATAHREGIKVLGMIDLGQVPENAAREHPDWCTQDAEGRLVERVPGLYASCPMGGFQTTYIREIVREILGRYDLDCVKFGGGSFGFSRSVCYCPACREGFARSAGHDLPSGEDWNDPLWRTYTAWRIEQARRRVHQLGEIVHHVDPTMPFMGNSVCFGDPGWTVGAAIDVEHQAAVADAVQVEVQTRGRYDEASGEAEWQYLSWPAETARFMTSVSRTPIWVVASYFLAWPWRRTAMPGAEQKVYLAQVAANGADPMVNLSGGPPAVHEDPRGFQAIEELYGFLAEHRSAFEGDSSGANVAIVYSLETLFFYGQSSPRSRYVEPIRGFEQALHEAHIPFDIISAHTLLEGDLSRYRVLVLPSLACMTGPEAEAIRAFVDSGGSLVATGETSLYDSQGWPRESFLLADLLGCEPVGAFRSSMQSPETGYKQVYMHLAASSPLFEGIADTSVLPMGGSYLPVRAGEGTAVPLTLSAPFIVFPEGYAYPTQPASHDPLALVYERSSGGRVVYFPGQPDALFWQIHYPDHGRLLSNAVTWAVRAILPVRVKGPATMQVSVRRQAGRRLVHLINLSGGPRYFSELLPLTDIRVGMPVGETGVLPTRAWLLSDGQELSLSRMDGAVWATVPLLRDYDVIVFEDQA